MKVHRKNNVYPYSDYAVLILSCDKYSDLWDPFFSQMQKFWPQRSFKIYLGSNTKKYHNKSVSTILSGPGKDWSSDLISILGKMKEKYLLISMEDLFPTEAIDSERVLTCFKFMESNKAKHIHFAPVIPPDGICDNTTFGYYEKGAPYRVTAQGFWDREALLKLLIAGENPWKFEIMGSYRSSYDEGYYTVTKPLYPFIRVVDKGKITREAYDYCRMHGIVLNTKRRRVFEFKEKVIGDINAALFKLILMIPWRMRVNVVEKIRRIVVSY